MLYFAAVGNNAAAPPRSHAGHHNYGSGIRTTVLAVIISNRRDLIVFSHGGGLLTGASAVRVRAYGGGWGGCTGLIALMFYAFIIIPGDLRENKPLPEMK